MKNATRYAAALALTLALLGSIQGQAARPAVTTVTVPTMDCGGCAKKVCTQLTAIPGVGQATPNVEARVIVVVPQPNAGVSPRALWEAVEKAGHTPSKVESPYGVFTAKPQI